MRKIFFLLLFVALNAFAQKDIVVLHSNDCHSQIFPFSKNLADKKKANLGGFTRRVRICCFSIVAISLKALLIIVCSRGMWRSDL